MNRIAGRVQRAQARVEDHAVGVGGGGGQALSEKVQRQRPIREGSSDEEAERSSANTPTKAPSPLPGMESSARRPAAGDLRWKHTAEVFTVARAGADARAPAPRQQVPVLEGNMSPPPATPLRQPSPQCCVACAVLWRVRGGALEPPWHTRRSRPLYRESEKSLATDVWGAVCTGVRLTVLALERAGRLYFMATPLPPSASGVHFFTMDNQMRYAPFCDDFGPFNLGMTHHFCQVLKDLLCQRRLDNTKICYYTSTGQNDLTNAIFLLGAFMVIHLDVHPEQAWQPFGKFASVIRPYRDATWCPSPYDLSLLHCWQAVRKAMRCNLYHPDTFDAEEYFYYDHPSNGDMHEVVKSKFFAFKGPTDRPEKYYTKRPLDYVDVFKAKKIKGVVRLNNKQYDARLLERHGFQHHDLFFTDCSTPSDAIVEKFLRLSEETEGSLAVHCLAGLGRTGTLIAMWMMKHLRFTANECIGWLRIVRPGSVIGPQQQYLKDQEQRMWTVGASGVAGLGLGQRHSLSLSDLSAWSSSCNPDLSAELADQITKGMQMRDSDKVKDKVKCAYVASGPPCLSHAHQPADAAQASPGLEARRRSVNYSRSDTPTVNVDVAPATGTTTTIKLPAVQKGPLRVSYTPRDAAALRHSSSSIHAQAMTATATTASSSTTSTPSAPSSDAARSRTPQRGSSGRRSGAGGGGGSLHLHQLDKSRLSFDDLGANLPSPSLTATNLRRENSASRQRAGAATQGLPAAAARASAARRSSVF